MTILRKKDYINNLQIIKRLLLIMNELNNLIADVRLILNVTKGYFNILNPIKFYGTFLLFQEK